MRFILKISERKNLGTRQNTLGKIKNRFTYLILENKHLEISW